MSGARRRLTKRERRVWLSVLATIGGTLSFAALAILIDRLRDTDYGNPGTGVTAAFKDTEDTTAPSIRFRDVASELGVATPHGPGQRTRRLPEDTGSGIAWGDIDGDDDVDLYVVNFLPRSGASKTSEGENRLYRNDADRFTDVTEVAGVGDVDGFGMGASFADFDDDGDLDLYVTNVGPNRLFRNLGGGKFEEVADAAGVADPAWSTGVTWGDFDRDGRLDLYVCNYVDYEEIPGIDEEPEYQFETDGRLHAVPFTLNPNSFDPVTNRLYRNLGEGRFEDVAEKRGVANPEGRSLAACFCDLDGDGWLDLYVNNDVSTNKLYRNIGGDGSPETRFLDLSTLTGTADPRGSMGLSIAEIGNLTGEPDGLPDIFITHWVAQENALYQSVAVSEYDLEYRDRTRRFRLGEISIDTVGWGSAFVDLDLDGRVDLVVANGSTLERKADRSRLVEEPLFLLWNTGKRFVNVAKDAGEASARHHSARGLAAADFDGDGDVDLAVSVNRGSPLLLRNDTKVPHRGVTIRLDGPSGACFGARVEVRVGERRDFRWYGADVGYLGSHSPDLVFGLGTSAAADEVRVRWADGRESVRTEVPAGVTTVTHPKEG